MKVLVLNGSPKGEKAILLTLQKHFLTAFQPIRKLNISRLKGNNQAVYGLLFVLEQNTRQMCYKGRYAENLRKD